MSINYSTLTYQNVQDAALTELNEPKVGELSTKIIIQWICDAQKKVCDLLKVEGSQDLRLIAAQEDYNYSYTKDAAGTGTISGAGTAMVGVGTTFLTEVVRGSKIKVGTDVRTVLTVTDNTNLVVDSAFTNPLVGSAFTYTQKATEISPEMRKIVYIDRLEGSFNRNVRIEDIAYLLELRKLDATRPYTNFDKPYVVSPYKNLGRRMLKLYPPADVDKTITLHGRLEVKPRLHAADVMTDTITLTEEYESVIRYYLVFLYAKRFGFMDKAKMYASLFKDEISTFKSSTETRLYVEMEYT